MLPKSKEKSDTSFFSVLRYMSLKSSPFQCLSRTLGISWLFCRWQVELLALLDALTCPIGGPFLWRGTTWVEKPMMYYDSELHWKFSSLSCLQTKTNLLCFVLVSDTCQYIRPCCQSPCWVSWRWCCYSSFRVSKCRLAQCSRRSVADRFCPSWASWRDVIQPVADGEQPSVQRQLVTLTWRCLHISQHLVPPLECHSSRSFIVIRSFEWPCAIRLCLPKPERWQARFVPLMKKVSAAWFVECMFSSVILDSVCFDV